MASSRLDFLKRKNSGRALRAEWEGKLTKMAGMPRGSWQFLDLDATDRVRQKSELTFPARPTLARAAPSGDFIEVQIELALATQAEKPLVPSSAAALFVLLRDSDKLGALSLTARVLNQYWKALLHVERDGFVVTGDAPLGQLVLQIISDTDAGREMLDLAAWGETWVATIKQFVGAIKQSPI
jgi:hypothetical protein